MKKVLVTGANGYVGRHIVDELINRGFYVIASDLYNSNINESAEYLEIPILGGDRDIYTLTGCPDICIHLAWQDGFMHNKSSHLENLSKHYEFLINMANGGCENIAVMGTMHEVGYWNGMIDENTPCSPSSMYGIAKNALRQAMLIHAQNKTFNLYWLRAYYILGDDRKNNSIFSKILMAAEDGKTEFPFTSGKNQYDFIEVSRLAEMIVDAISQSEITGVINVCNGEPESLASKVEGFIKNNNLNIRLQYGVFPDRSYDSPVVFGSNALITQIQRKANLKRAKI